MKDLITNKWTALFFSNFLGVFNDNLLKNCIIFIGVAWTMPAWMSQSQLISLVSSGLVIPYLVLSPAAGQLAVRHSKLKIFRSFKLLELPVMLLACIAFYYQWIMLAIITVFIMGILSCLYSPSKYSLIRDIGGEEGVSFGSGVFEMMAFMGILLGTVAASFLSDNQSYNYIMMFFLGVAFLGFYVTTKIKVAEFVPIETEKHILNPFKYLQFSYQFAKNHFMLNGAVFGAAAFWLIGGMLQMNLVIHSKNVYNLSNSKVGLIMACTAIGIAFGCWLAGKISGKVVKSGLLLIGIVGMIFYLSILTFTKLNIYFYAFSVVNVAFMGGFFQIPCLSIIQKSDIGRKLGDMIAYLNLVTFIFVLMGTLMFSATTYFFHENSFYVFGVILSFSIFVLLYYLIKFPMLLNDSLILMNFGKKIKT